MVVRATTPGPIPKEALRYFRAKKLKVGFSHLDVWREEHVASFTAAKIAELDILEDLRGHVERAIKDGTTFQQFRKDVDQLMDRSGWSDYHLGTPKKTRLRTIYQTNMRTARAAGQWGRIERTKKLRPYLIYELGPSLHHRPEHVAWAGTILPVDDPFWDIAMVPSGWGCKCRVRQLSRRVYDRERVKKGRKTRRPRTPLEPWENKKTGKVEMVPRGIQPGFDFNPGKHRMRGLERAAKEHGL